MPRTKEGKGLLFRIPPQPEISLREAVRRDLFLTHHEAAAYMRATPDQVMRWMRAGYLDVYEQPGGRRVLRAIDVRDVIRSRHIPGAA